MTHILLNFNDANYKPRGVMVSFPVSHLVWHLITFWRTDIEIWRERKPHVNQLNEKPWNSSLLCLMFSLCVKLPIEIGPTLGGGEAKSWFTTNFLQLHLCVGEQQRERKSMPRKVGEEADNTRNPGVILLWKLAKNNTEKRRKIDENFCSLFGNVII